MGIEDFFDNHDFVSVDLSDLGYTQDPSGETNPNAAIEKLKENVTELKEISDQNFIESVTAILSGGRGELEQRILDELAGMGQEVGHKVKGPVYMQAVSKAIRAALMHELYAGEDSDKLHVVLIGGKAPGWRKEFKNAVNQTVDQGGVLVAIPDISARNSKEWLRQSTFRAIHSLSMHGIRSGLTRITTPHNILIPRRVNTGSIRMTLDNLVCYAKPEPLTVDTDTIT